MLMQPYTIMKLPGEKRAEFIQMLPFTPRRKDNLARLDGGGEATATTAGCSSSSSRSRRSSLARGRSWPGSTRIRLSRRRSRCGTSRGRR